LKPDTLTLAITAALRAVLMFLDTRTTSPSHADHVQLHADTRQHDKSLSEHAAEPPVVARNAWKCKHYFCASPTQ
jgi:hypothetical protein